MRDYSVEVPNDKKDPAIRELQVLYVSGQTSNNASGAPMHPGDLAPQFKLAWKNLIEVLAAAEMTPQNIVRLNFYTRCRRLHGKRHRAGADFCKCWM